MKQVIALAVTAIISSIALGSSAMALSGADFQAGHIIDDTIFYNPNLSGNVSDIQNFLNSKVPACDTNGTQAYGGSTRAAYGASKGYPAPFTCLRDYRQTIPTKTDASNICSPIQGGDKSSAEIIYAVSQSCGINPAVLLTLLEKEQGLITDSWPWSIQYRSATGYGCPDTGACDADYYGFFNQVYSAARQFKKYKQNPLSYGYVAGRTNFVQFNPESSCGGSNVYIKNAATAGLYNYTPYQPNTAALNNIMGSGDSCSAYGNRNFWRLFTTWFGTTLTSARVNFTYTSATTDTTGQVVRIGVSLNQPVTSPVTISLALSDPSMAGLASPNPITIQPSAWNRPDLNQIVVYGKNNGTQVGAKQYSVVTGNISSADPNFKQLTGEYIDDIYLTNTDASRTDVYRLYSSSLRKHYYTGSISERDALLAQSYVSEGTGFYGCRSGDTTIFSYTKGGKSLLTPLGGGEYNVLGTLGYSNAGPQFSVSKMGPISVYRLYNATTDDHLFTTSAGERASAIATGYTDEGVGFKTCDTNQQPVYRLYNTATSDHFYTTLPSERDVAGGVGYMYEGVGFYTCNANNSVPVYRLFSQRSGDHFYTSDQSEYNSAVGAGYAKEGVGFSMCPAVTGSTKIQRLFNPQTEDHMYTGDATEYQSAQKYSGYVAEGASFYTDGNN